MRRITIDYTVYAPDFKPGKSPCWDFRTFLKAKAAARRVGSGARAYRNFNRISRDWSGSKYYWL